MIGSLQFKVGMQQINQQKSNLNSTLISLSSYYYKIWHNDYIKENID